MERKILIYLIICCIYISTIPIYAADSNISSGGGGMGEGTSQNKWISGRDGVRVTVVHISDKQIVGRSYDFSNQENKDVKFHFGQVNKISYLNGTKLNMTNGKYYCYQPKKAMPRIISSTGKNNIKSIRNYFCRKGTLKDIATATGVEYKMLINGEYKILLEPIAYLKYHNVMYAMTATEAALFNQKTSNGVRSKLVSLTHKNLPFSMFLEEDELGFSAWKGSTLSPQSDETIIRQLGIGVIRFSEEEETLEPIKTSVIYRCDTDVITSVELSSSIKRTPNSPAYVTFLIDGKMYSHTNIYIPEGGSQLAWVKWHTPKKAGKIKIVVTSNCSVSSNEIIAKIVDYSKKIPPDPQAGDREDEFQMPVVPTSKEVTNLTWGSWDCWWQPYWVWISLPEGGGYYVDFGWWEYDWISYSASLSVTATIGADEKNPTKKGKEIKSGYGINASVGTKVYSNAPSSDITGVQTVITSFPEFQYEEYYRLLKKENIGLSSHFCFDNNKYSTFYRPVHFTPIWFPDGNYTPYFRCVDAWTPAGMLQVGISDTIKIKGNLYDDWHIRPD